MKKRILAAILAVLMVFPLIMGVYAEEPAEEDEIVDYSKVVFNDKLEIFSEMTHVATSPNKKLELYMHSPTGIMAVKNTVTGEIVLTNPYTQATSGLTTKQKQQILSQVILNYTVISTGSANSMYSYSDAFLVGQAKWEKLSDGTGIKVSYVLGEQKEKELVPFKIAKEDFENVIAKMKEAGLNVFEIQRVYDNYTLFDPWQKKEDGSYVNGESVRNDFIRQYPLCETKPLYVIDRFTGEHKELENFFKKAGYTFEQLDKDYAKVKEETDSFSMEARPKFEMEAVFQITDEGLRASVDASTIVYDATKYYINSVSILPYMNAADANIIVSTYKCDTCKGTFNAYEKPKACPVCGHEGSFAVEMDESGKKLEEQSLEYGYTFIPDGSGMLVRFENVKKKGYQVNIESNMYGNDYAYYQIVSKNAESLTMPVFGLVNETAKTGFFAIIEDGDALATLISCHNSDYNSIYASFKITPKDVYDLADSFSGGSSSSNKINITASQIYKGKCVVNYVMLTDSDVARESGLKDYVDNSYVGMATYYRNLLTKNGSIDKLKNDEINSGYTKLFLETFGSLKVEEKIATFPVTVNKALTTFEDVKTIHDELNASGVGNMSFILKGFTNGGILSSYPTKIKWQKVLGGEKGLNDLLKYAKEKDFEVSPDIEFSYAYGGDSNGFKLKKDGVRTLDNRYTTKRIYYAATQTFERTGGIAVSSASFERLYEKFYKSISEYDLEYLAVRSLGSDLNSDFDEEDYYDREAAKDNVVKMLQLLKGSTGNKAFKLIVDSGNAYTIPYADAILGASLDSSRRIEASESIPFFGIVYHGSIEFAGNAFNMEGDTEYMFLKAIENGANLYFTVAKQNVELLKFEEEYNKYYSVSYDNLKGIITSTYKKYNELMKDVQNQYIVGHEFLNSGEALRNEFGKMQIVDNSMVVRVEYENGICFILNYCEEDVYVTLPEFGTDKNGKPITQKVEGFGCYKYQIKK